MLSSGVKRSWFRSGKQSNFGLRPLYYRSLLPPFARACSCVVDVPFPTFSLSMHILHPHRPQLRSRRLSTGSCKSSRRRELFTHCRGTEISARTLPSVPIWQQGVRAFCCWRNRTNILTVTASVTKPHVQLKLLRKRYYL